MQLKFEFTVDESNQILQSLGDQPYAKVADLINKLRSQAMSQINAVEAANAESVAAAVTTA